MQNEIITVKDRKAVEESSISTSKNILEVTKLKLDQSRHEIDIRSNELKCLKQGLRIFEMLDGASVDIVKKNAELTGILVLYSFF